MRFNTCFNSIFIGAKLCLANDSGDLKTDKKYISIYESGEQIYIDKCVVNLLHVSNLIKSRWKFADFTTSAHLLCPI